MDYDAVIVGGGPAGLMAAIAAAGRGRRTLLVEKNRRPGIKVLMSGGTRCNLTHATDARGIVAAFGPQGKFLHSALAALGPADVVAWFAAQGVPTYVEPGGKVFPQSDRAADVHAALLRAVVRSGCHLACGEPLVALQRAEGGFRLQTAARTLTAQSVLLCTGGCSYPACGTTGDGYGWAAALGHTIVALRPALAPLTTHARWVTALQGIALEDVAVAVHAVADAGGLSQFSRSGNGTVPFARHASRGAMVFTHFGLSGPAPMDVSRAVNQPAGPTKVELWCDFRPEMPAAALAEWLDHECQSGGKRLLSTALGQLLPNRLADALVAVAVPGGDCRAAEAGRDARRRLVQAVKQARVPLSGTLGLKKAEVTAGGVALAEVDSRSMQSKLVPGLFFAGELLDLDGPIGGFNFQAAFCTGHLAGTKL